MRPRASAPLVSAVLLGVFFLSLYLLIGSSDLYHNGDTDLRYQTTQAMVDHHRLWIADPMWKDTREARGIGGHLYAFYAPGQTVFMVPLYIAGRFLAHHLSLPYDVTTLYASRSLDLFLGAALAVMFFVTALSTGYSIRTAALLTLVFGLATPALPDAQSALEQTQVDLFLLLAVWSVWTFVRNGLQDRRWLVLAGFAAGLGFFTRYDFAIYVPVLLLYPEYLRAREVLAQRGYRRSSEGGGGLSPASLTLARRTESDPQSLHSVLDNDERDFAGRGVRRSLSQAVLGDWLAFGGGLFPWVALVGFWDLARFGNAFRTGLHERTLGEPFLSGLLGLLVSPGKGLVWYLPLVFLLPWCLPAFRRRTGSLLPFTAALALVPLLFYANILYWHGDPAWGPRYLYTAIPYLVLPLGELLEGWNAQPRVLQLFALALVLASLTLQVAATSVTQWRFWYRLEALEENTSRPFLWGASNYHYYWNPRQSPIVFQLDDVYQVARLNLFGSEQYRLTARPTRCVIGTRCISNPADIYPINTFAFWWADTRHPLLGPRTRAAIAFALTMSGLLSLLVLLSWILHQARVSGGGASERRSSDLSGKQGYPREGDATAGLGTSGPTRGSIAPTDTRNAVEVRAP